MYNYWQSHKISQIKDQVSGRTEQFSYDLNGNVAQRVIPNIQLDYNWDEENRLRSFTKKDKLSETTHLYYYDASGERIIKIKGTTEKLFQNADLSSAQLLLRDFTLYPSAFLTQSDSKITKHYYAGTKRIASRIEMKPATEPRLTPNSELKLKQETDLVAIAIKLGCDKFKYEFSQFDDESEDTEDTLRADVSPIFFYHPDHLGTSTIVTNASGTLHQYFFNLPFGETMIEGCTNTNYQLNYKFNAKELDAESGMYYYGARYYDPRISVWMSVDPMAEASPNKSPFIFCSGNPFSRIDPTGLFDGWIKGNNIIYHDPSVRSQKDMTDKGLEGTYMGETGTWSSANGIQYDLNADGTKSVQNIAEIVGKFEKSEDQSFAGWYDRRIGKYVADGGNDLCNSGGTTAEGWKGTLKIVSTMASAGTLLEARTAYTIISSSLGLLNSVDEHGENEEGEGFIEQNMPNQEMKNYVRNIKGSVSITNFTNAASSIKTTLKSPFSTGSMIFDLKSAYEFANEKKE